MRSIRWLAVVPFLALIVGPFFVNRATPFVLDMPFLLAWIVAWILLTSVIMAVIYAADPANLGWFSRCQFYVDGRTVAFQWHAWCHAPLCY